MKIALIVTMASLFVLIIIAPIAVLCGEFGFYSLEGFFIKVCKALFIISLVSLLVFVCFMVIKVI